MEPTTILILVLSAWIVALLVWFEINSRRNQARSKPGPQPCPSASDPLKGAESEVSSEAKNKKAA
jgi:hypothetical protein